MAEGDQSVNVQKTAEELKRQQERDAKEREAYIASKVPKLDLGGLDQSGLSQKCRTLYEAVSRLEEEKYDAEVKLRKMEFDLSELNITVNDIKGQFVKPPLNKVSKTEQKLAKIAEVKSKLGGSFRGNLKSTGQPKFTVEEKEEGGSKPSWSQDQIKHKEEGGEGLAGEEAAADEEEEEEEEE